MKINPDKTLSYLLFNKHLNKSFFNKSAKSVELRQANAQVLTSEQRIGKY